MYGPRCDHCRHYNHPGADFCEACEAPLAVAPAAGEPRRAGDRPAVQDSPADAVPSPPFKGAGDVVSPMLAVYRKHFTTVGILVLLTMVPEALVRYGLVDFGRSEVLLASAGMDFTSVPGWLLWLLAMAATSLLAGSLVYAVLDLQVRGMASAGECLSRGLAVWPKVFIVLVLYTLIIWAGFLLLFVPGVIFGMMFTVCVPAAVVEGLGPVDALKRSYELTKGYKGLIFATTFLWGLLILAVNWLVVWSFARGAKLDLLPTLLLQTAVQGMLHSTAYVLNVYVYLGLLRERRGAVPAGAPAAAP